MDIDPTGSKVVLRTYWFHPKQDMATLPQVALDWLAKWKQWNFEPEPYVDELPCSIPYNLVQRGEKYWYDPSARVKGIGYPHVIGRKAMSDLFRWSVLRDWGGAYTDLDNEPLRDPRSDWTWRKAAVFAIPAGPGWGNTPSFLWANPESSFEERKRVTDRMFREMDKRMTEAEKRGNKPNLMRGSYVVGPGVVKWAIRAMPGAFQVIPTPYLTFDLPPKHMPPFPKETVILNHGRWKVPWGDD